MTPFAGILTPIENVLGDVLEWLHTAIGLTWAWAIVVLVVCVRIVILPLTIPAQSTLAVFTFLGSWNDYWWPLISATRSDMYTLTVGLAASQMNYAQTSGLGFLMAQAVFASIPIFIVYIVFQKQIVRAMAGAAVR